MSDATHPLPEVEATKKGGSKLILIIALVVLAGGGGGAWWFLRPSSAEAAADAKTAEDPGKFGVYGFETFLVNLADPGGSRFVKTTIQVVVPTPKDAAHLKDAKVLVMRARSAIIELLALQTADVLVTPEGKQALRDAIREKVNEAFVNIKVHDVLFSDFVVQF
jgi:flagellar FliL protein